MDRRRRRGTSKHAGVVLKRRTLPSGALGWRARYRDPDTGKTKYETLPDVLTTEEERSAWAARKAEQLRDRSHAIASGSPTKKNTTLTDAITRFYEDVSPQLRPQTLRAYRMGTAALLEWASTHRIELSDDLRAEHLAGLRSWLMNKPLLRQVKGGRRNRAHAKTASIRSPYTVNRELAPIKTCLEHLRRHGLVPMLTRDAISDNLERVTTPRPVPEYLKPSALVTLIEAAHRHDQETFALTRHEKAHGEHGDKTTRYDPILPYLATVLLSGMREGEARLVRWSSVDLDEPPAGTIKLRPEEVKTKHGRMVDLIVSPLLRELLLTLRVRSGECGSVFGGDEPFSRSAVEATRKRLIRSHGAPAFSWQQLRVTCGTFLANAPGIFGAASAYREARQLGHSVTVAEKHYLGVVHVDPAARTLEAAMGTEKALRTTLGLPAKANAQRARGQAKAGARDAR